MITFTEAQLIAWLSPILWPFVRVLALFSALPVLGQRTVPVRVRVAPVDADRRLPRRARCREMPVVPLDSPAGLLR